MYNPTVLNVGPHVNVEKTKIVQLKKKIILGKHEMQLRKLVLIVADGQELVRQSAGLA